MKVGFINVNVKLLLLSGICQKYQLRVKLSLKCILPKSYPKDSSVGRTKLGLIILVDFSGKESIVSARLSFVVEFPGDAFKPICMLFAETTLFLKLNGRNFSFPNSELMRLPSLSCLNVTLEANRSSAVFCVQVSHKGSTHM